MFLLIDNYDSFTYNLVQAFYALGREPYVLYNDDARLLDLAKAPDLEMVCLSPGPSRPENAGLCLEFLRRLTPSVPVLGVCLGHQILGLFGGGRVEVAEEIMHGKQSEISHNPDGLFTDLPPLLKVGRYHSLVVKDGQDLPFEVTARGPRGEIMALQYRDRRYGVVSEAVMINRKTRARVSVKNEAFARRGGHCRRICYLPANTSYRKVRYTGAYQIERSKEGSEELTATILGAYDADAGDLVQVDNSNLGVKGRFTVREVVRRFGADGETTTLRMQRE